MDRMWQNVHETTLYYLFLLYEINTPKQYFTYKFVVLYILSIHLTLN